MTALDIIRAAGGELCRPWPRHILAVSDWRRMAAALSGDPLVLLALWADSSHVHALFFDETDIVVVPVSTSVQDGAYPALSPARPGAAWFERAIKDLWGHQAEDGTDARGWLDHGHWPLTHPLSPRPGPPPHPIEPPTFRDDPDDGGMRLPVGPVWGLIEDASHLRMTLTQRNTVAGAETRLGYAHRGTLALMRGKSPRAAARFAARLAGDMTVAHATAFALAAEYALDTGVPPRAVALRAAMLEIERIACHLSALGATAGEAGFATVQTHCATAREELAQATGVAFGHRLMMDGVIPGGLGVDIALEGASALTRALAAITTMLPGLHRAFERSALATRLSDLGRVTRAQVEALAAGGIAGRAAGRVFDARFFSIDLQRTETALAGDAAARSQLRLREIGVSAERLAAILRALPAGPVAITLPATSGEGIGFAESARGDIWCWLRLDHGQIAGVFCRDPGWALWPLYEQALRGAEPDAASLIHRSFDLSGPGMDL
jgi:Ni,Fe-hydrogenase III large subunit